MSNPFFTIVKSPIFLSAFCSFLLAQSLKFIIYFVKKRGINFRVLLDYGGMPSAHSATVVALATSVGREVGWESPLFIVAFIWAFITIGDAVIVRRAAGRQATILNRMVEDFYRDGKIKEERLKELLGHTPIEVIIGGLLGCGIAVLFT
jgi:hypothetical protein